MSNLTPTDAFSDVYQLETTDVVIGGVGSKSNVQAQNLANRTNYLKQRFEESRGVPVSTQIAIAGTTAFAIGSFGKFNQLTSDGTGLITASLPALADLTDADIGKKILFKNAGQFDGNGIQSGNVIVARIKGAAAESSIVDCATEGVSGIASVDLEVGEYIELTIGKTGADYYYFITMLIKNFSNQVVTRSMSASETMLSKEINKVVVLVFGSSVNIVYNLLAASAFPEGASIVVSGALLHDSGNPCAITRAGSDTIVDLTRQSSTSFIGTTTYTINKNDFVRLTTNGADKWFITDKFLDDTGEVVQVGRSTALTGMLLCDGSAVSRTTYARLFDVVGTAFGAGDGSTTFNVPTIAAVSGVYSYIRY